MPEIASRHHLELVNAVVDDALAQADSSAGRRGPGRGHRRPGPGRRAARRRRHRQGAGRCARASRSRRSTTCRATSPPTSSEPEPFEPPFVCLVASGGHTFIARVTGHDGFEVLGQTLDDAAGEAFDKGARMLGLPFPGGPHIERLAAEGDPERVRLPDRRGRTGPRLLVRGPQDGAALQGARPRRAEDRGAQGRPRGGLPARDRRGAGRPGGAGARPDRARPARDRGRRRRQRAAAPPDGVARRRPEGAPDRACAPTTRR